ncbi:hypothetical protein Bca52824_068929 [Brassica carinata]|uniref:Uncharacterized protein n=1 Tax=Brassica carinata TaxID=52824 RepID=A0A8X7Q3J5_BRACI|nr:hypothetical protein Bca52824_068929 [Brassica carinata]
MQQSPALFPSMPITKPLGSNTTLRSQPPHQYSKPPLLVILTVILLVVFFIGFCALYFCKCFFHTVSQAWDRRYGNRSPGNQIQSQQENASQPPVNPVIHENSNGNHEQPSTSNEVSLSRLSSSSGKTEPLPDKFSRSKTTGHSIVRNKPEEEDRYTLRLPDHVKIKVTRRHNNNQTESCISFGELMRNKQGRILKISLSNDDD